MRYFFHIAYNGTNYRGWQKLPQIADRNLQDVIESNLTLILKKKTTIVGCGRTDAQVHASQFFFHVDIEDAWDYDLLFRLNKNLPVNISVFDIIPVEERQHARFDAIERTYNYFIHTYKDPYLNNTSAFYPKRELRLDEMARAVSLLLKYEDYNPFTRKHLPGARTICRVTKANLYLGTDGESIRFEIMSNRFLKGMIRIIMHKLMLIGRGEMTVDEFEQCFITKQRAEIDRLAHPQGLYLSKVTYPYLDLAPKSEFFHMMAADERWKLL